MRPLKTPLVVALAMAGACAPPPGSEISSTRQAVVNGREATTCQFPSVVLVDMETAICSGTLVSPRLVTLAGHCGGGGEVLSINFGEDARRHPTRKVNVTSCQYYPNFATDVNDVGYCVLAEAVEDVPIAPILMGCETAALKRGALVTLAGFGVSSGKAAGDDTWGLKRWAQVPILNDVGAMTDGIQVGSTTTTGCDGDSGGPIFMQLGDGTWRTLGVASTTAVSRDRECVPPTTYVSLGNWVDWIETSSGVDITPCSDARGNPQPGPGCGGFATSFDRSTGTWATGCGGPGTRSGPGSLCVPAPDAGLSADAAPARDAASVPDAAPDPAAPPDTATVPDAPTTTITTPASDEGGGCSCDTGRGSPHGVALLILTLAFAWRQRRALRAK
jgi:MYXO-CTERM domain-containing protein